MTDAGAAARLRDQLEHPDPTQLWFQLQEIVIDRGYLRHGIEVGEGDVVFDVGANVGVAAAYFAVVRGARRVHSFEPVPELFALLERNVAHHPACVAHPYGLSDRAETVEFTYYPRAAAMSGRYADPESDRAVVRSAMLALGIDPELADAELAERYAATTRVEVDLRPLSEVIEELGEERIDLLKIDVERAELDVLAGIGDDDWPRIAQIACEVHDVAGRLDTIRAQVERHGLTATVDQALVFARTPIKMLFARR